MAKSPLGGIKIIEYGEVISAPYCSKLMAGLGAEVIKVEKPVAGIKPEVTGHSPTIRMILRRAVCFYL